MKNTVFIAGDDFRNNAIVRKGKYLWDLMADGYKIAADMLVEQVIKTNRKQDYLLYPICYLYRHSLELYLKQIVYLWDLLNHKKPAIKRSHKLDVLWLNAHKAIMERWSNKNSEEVEEIGNIICQIHKIDSSAQAFRYHGNDRLDNNVGDSLLPDKINLINIRILGSKLSRALVFLENCCYGLQIDIENNLNNRDNECSEV